MKISFSWLKEFIEIELDPHDVADKLTMAGIETSSVTYLGEGFDRIVVGEIEKLEKHPGADRLSLLTVHDGKALLPIVCGAKNIKEGDRVPLALAGAKLPGGEEIKKSKIRGTLSEGMICSERELGLSDDHEGIMILPPAIEAGTPITEALYLDDYLLEVEITPNRGDCLSVFGIAREVAAIYGTNVVQPEVPLVESGLKISDEVSIGIEDLDLCPRYSARVLKDVEISPSPMWLRRRLQASGIRPINNIVDITNYLLLEFGQPMHAFDLDRLSKREIIVKRAGDVSSFKTLDGVKREITSDTLLIWDGEKPVALAGIMGGENSEVSGDSVNILFESAHFSPRSIRRSSKHLGLSTESSYRFERGVDPSGTLYAVDRAISILSTFSHFVLLKGAIDVRERGKKDSGVIFRTKWAEKIAGLPLEKEESKKVFKGLGFRVEDADKSELRVFVPSHRFDIEREIDLVEEVVRIKGYDKVPTTYPPSGTPHLSEAHEFNDFKMDITSKLAALGLMETINYSFMAEKLFKDLSPFSGDFQGEPIRLANPISDDMDIMRSSLIPGLLKDIKINVSRYNLNLKLFEFGKIFKMDLIGKGYEEVRLGMVFTGEQFPGAYRGMGKYVDFPWVRSLLENIAGTIGIKEFHVARDREMGLCGDKEFGAIYIDGKPAGYIGTINEKVLSLFEITQKVYCIELDMEYIFSSRCGSPSFSPISKYPPVERDISFIVESQIPGGDIIEYVTRVDDSLVKKVQVFDVYQSDRIGMSKKSIGMRITYQSENRTLTEREVNDIHKKIIRLIENRFGATVRRG